MLSHALRCPLYLDFLSVPLDHQGLHSPAPLGSKVKMYYKMIPQRISSILVLDSHLEVQGSQYLLKPGKNTILMRSHNHTHTDTHKHSYTQTQKCSFLGISYFNSKPLAPVSPEKNETENNKLNKHDNDIVSVEMKKIRSF